jgi:hypothetical protein
MGALMHVAAATNNPQYIRQAKDLGLAAHKGFVYERALGSLRMYWKMAIDLSRPLVGSAVPELIIFIAAILLSAALVRMSCDSDSFSFTYHYNYSTGPVLRTSTAKIAGSLGQICQENCDTVKCTNRLRSSTLRSETLGQMYTDLSTGPSTITPTNHG